MNIKALLQFQAACLELFHQDGFNTISATIEVKPEKEEYGIVLIVVDSQRFFEEGGKFTEGPGMYLLSTTLVPLYSIEDSRYQVQNSISETTARGSIAHSIAFAWSPSFPE